MAHKYSHFGMHILLIYTIEEEPLRCITMNTYLIYKRTCRTTNLSYIGLTKGLETFRWISHYKERNKPNMKGTKLSIALSTYGPDDWDVEILERGLSKAEAEAKEIYYIAHFNTYYKGYNGTLGGEGGRNPKDKVVVIDLTTGSFTIYSDVHSAAAATGVKMWVIRGHLYQPNTYRYYVRSNLKFMKERAFNPEILTQIVKETREDMKRTYHKMKYLKAKAVEAYYLDTGELIETFDTTKDAARKFDIAPSGIRNVCIGSNHYAGKLNGRKVAWRYKVA